MQNEPKNQDWILLAKKVSITLKDLKLTPYGRRTISLGFAQIQDEFV